MSKQSEVVSADAGLHTPGLGLFVGPAQPEVPGNSPLSVADAASLVTHCFCLCWQCRDHSAHPPLLCDV